MKTSAILVAAAVALAGISVAASPVDAQNRPGRGIANNGGARGPAPGLRQGGQNFARTGAGVQAHGGRGGIAMRSGNGGGHGWHRGGPGPRHYGGRGNYRGGPGPGFAVGAAALGLAAGALLGAPSYVDEPPIYADECMQQVWLRGAWRWRNVCD